MDFSLFPSPQFGVFTEFLFLYDKRTEIKGYRTLSLQAPLPCFFPSPITASTLIVIVSISSSRLSLQKIRENN
jgi:hypothetical protein